MEENSRNRSNLSHVYPQESESRTSMNSKLSISGARRELLIRERLLERQLQKHTHTRDDKVAVQSFRGEKRRSQVDEPHDNKSVNTKQVKTTNTITLDNQVLADCTVVVKADTIDNVTSDRKVLPIARAKDQDKPQDEKLKPEHGVGKSIRKRQVTPTHEHTSELKRKALQKDEQPTSNVHDRTDVNTSGQPKDDNQFHDCPKLCVCKIGPNPLPRPTVRRGYKQKTPLYKKLLQCRLLSTVNMVFNKCCAHQCSQVWCQGRYSRSRLGAGYDPSDLRVDIYNWGQWKQKAEVEKTGADDDWFW